MCSPNISSRSPRKSPSPCVTSRCGPSRGLLAGLALVAAILCGWGPVVCGEALAQVERRQLPVLPGEAPPQPDQDFGVPPAPPPPGQDFGATSPPAIKTCRLRRRRRPAENWSPDFKPRRQCRQSAGGAKARAPFLPISGAASMGAPSRRLLGQVPMPSPRPRSRACLRARLPRALSGGSETSVRVAALERAGRVNELIEMLGQSGNEPGALAPYALALLAAGRTEDACAVAARASEERRAARRSARAFLIPAYCAALSGDRGAARQALDVARDNGVDVAFAARAIGGQTQRAGSAASASTCSTICFSSSAREAARADLAAKATPELLFLLAHDDEAPAELRLAAAERAASLNIIDGETLANVYRDAAPKLPKSAQSPAALARETVCRARVADLGEDPRRVDRRAARKRQGREDRDPDGAGHGASERRVCAGHASASFAETGVRVAALAGDDQTAWDLTEPAGDRVRSWQLLLVTTDPFERAGAHRARFRRRHCAESRIAGGVAATPGHGARCARRRGADPALGPCRQDAAA